MAVIDENNKEEEKKKKEKIDDKKKDKEKIDDKKKEKFSDPKKEKEEEKKKEKEIDINLKKKESDGQKDEENLLKFKNHLSKENLKLFNVIEEELHIITSEYLEKFGVPIKNVFVDFFLLTKNPYIFYSGLVFSV